MNWDRILQPDILAMLVPIVAIVVVGAIAIAKMVIRHRERIAMIERGMDPDRRPERRDRQEPRDS